jgi:hypothetical protein
MPAAGTLLATLPQRLTELGVAVIGEPMTVPSDTSRQCV